MANNLSGNDLTLDPDYNLVLYGQTNQNQFTAEEAAAAGGVLLVAQGGTGANNQAAARTNLGAAASGSNGDITALMNLTGNVILNAVGAALKIKEGSNAAMGKSTLVGGTVTVNNTRVTNNSRIFLTHQNNSGAVGFPTISARVAGTSFTILSSSATDTSDVGWFIIEPA
jgi:hypothetical protein